MRYDSKLEGLLTFASAMSSGSASKGVETVHNEEQIRARNAKMLPKDMRPSQEAFEALGFTFKDIDDDILCKATLPHGWKLVADSGGYWTYIFDEKGRKRGSYFYKGAFYDRSGHMCLSYRFRTGYDFNDHESTYTVSAKDFDGKILFSAGKCKKLYSREYDSLIQKAKAFLHTNYPDCGNPCKYWD